MNLAAIGASQFDGAQHPVAPAGEKLKAESSRRRILRLWQNAPPASDHRIGCQHIGAGMAWRDGRKLGAGKPSGMSCRQFALQRDLVDFGRIDPIWQQADLAQQIAPPRRGGGENQRWGKICRGQGGRPGYLKRKVMRPLVKS